MIPGIKGIHKSCLGIEKAKRRASYILYWPQMNCETEGAVKICCIYQKHRPSQAKELMWVAQKKLALWSKVGIDLLMLYGKHYVLVLDCYSYFSEIALLSYCRRYYS